MNEFEEDELETLFASNNSSDNPVRLSAAERAISSSLSSISSQIELKIMLMELFMVAVEYWSE